MSTVRKYAGLPDLDPAPDIYETPDLTDDNSTHPTSTTFRSESPQSQGDDEDNSIDRHRIDPDEARTRFLPPAERETSLPSRISDKRKSYRSSSRKKRKDGSLRNDVINGVEISSDEEEESLERKLARLRREVAEVKEESMRDRKENDGAQEPNDDKESLDALSQVLDSIASPSAAGENGAARRLARRMASASTSREPPVNGGEVEDEKSKQNGESTTYTVSYAPRYHEDNALSKVSDFDSRLALLESALGIDAIPLPSQNRTPAQAVIPSLDKLDRQLTTLSISSESSIDAISRKVRQLTLDAEKLEHARKAAKAAQQALRQQPPSPSSTNADSEVAREISKLSDIEDHESVSKINALYGTLSTIESLAPILPSVLDRLRSLRALHADAATASQTLAKVESRQDEMTEELRGWREGLEKVEKAMEEGDTTRRANTELIGGWVKDLEERMRKLS